MEQWEPHADLTAAPTSPSKRRRAGRLDQELLVCQYGPVMNLSAGGMRVCTRRVPPKALIIELMGIGETIKVKAKLAWSRRVGLFKHDVGFEFVDVDPETARTLTQLATTCRMRRAM